MNVYTHTDLAEKAFAIAKLPSFEKHPAATSVLDAPASSQSDLQQRYSSSREAEIDIQRQSLSTVEKKDDRRALKSSGRKALPEKALSTNDEECHRISEVHLDGLEPSTFGSVDRCSIQLSYRCSTANCIVSLSVGQASFAQENEGKCRIANKFWLILVRESAANDRRSGHRLWCLAQVIASSGV